MIVFRSHRDVGYSTVQSARFAPPHLARVPFHLSPVSFRSPDARARRLSSSSRQEGPRHSLPPAVSGPPSLRRGAVSHCGLSLLFHITSGAAPLGRAARYVNAGRGKLKVFPRNVASATFQSLRKLRAP